MPSPLVHAPVACILWPLLGAQHSSRPVRWTLGGMLTLGCLGPDLDIAVGLFQGEAFALHGGAWHSVVAGAVFASVFALIAMQFLPGRGVRLWLIGGAAWWSHVLFDACTYGGGVAMFWPLLGDRISLPFVLFVGVRHSQPLAWDAHLLTLMTELPAAIGLIVIARLIRERCATRQHHCGSVCMTVGEI